MTATNVTASRVHVDDTMFRFAHGRAPRGTGRWAFDMDGDTFFSEGTFTEAKAAARKEAARRGVVRVKVGS